MENTSDAEDPLAQAKKRNSEEDFTSFSWTALSDSAVLKQIDKTVFIDHGTRIPKDFRSFFNVESLQPGDKRIIYFWYQNRRYEATIKMTILDFPRTQLSWKKDFSSLLQTTFPNWYSFFFGDSIEAAETPSLKFEKRSLPWEYAIEFLGEDNSVRNSQIQNELILTKYQEYSRKDVHGIFDKNSPFTPNAGKWGRSGIITHPTIKDDFIFLVTLDKQENDSVIFLPQKESPLREYVTENGILIWHSQQNQKLHEPQIQAFINHDYFKNSIYLFLRTEKSRKYTYFGRLARISYNKEVQQPVWFKWQILDWELEDSKAKDIGLILQPDTPTTIDEKRKAHSLNFTDPPEQNLAPPEVGESSTDFVAKKVNFSEDEHKKKEIGLAGEELVMTSEEKYLRENGRSNFISKIEHISKKDGDGAGYDIKSITLEGETKYIEVKTTIGGLNSKFDITINELNFSKRYADKYYLYRIYNFNKKTKSGDCYVFIGDISNHFFLKPTKFKCDPQIKLPHPYSFDVQ